MAEPQAPTAGAGVFDRDTAVRLEREEGPRRWFSAEVADGWRAGRGPHGGYLAAMLLRALRETVADPARSARSLTIHYARAPEPGPVTIETRIEREGRSLSTLSARMEQDGRLVALVLSAFSLPWSGPELADRSMPAVAPADATREAGSLLERCAPPFTRHIVLQPRIGGAPFSDAAQPMELGAWLGFAQPRAIDALALAFFSDALIPAPFMRLSAPNPAPTVDLTVHFRTELPHRASPHEQDMCFVHVRAGVIHEGFFEEDSTIWAPDGTLLAQSRQLALLLALPSG